MKQVIFTIESNRPIADGVYELRLSGDTSAIVRSGQFVEIALEGFFLRRPISVHDCSEGCLTLIYKVVGKGTDALAAMQAGEKLDLLTGLGNGFDASRCRQGALLVGGGVGVAPLLLLARELRAAGKEVSAVLGFNRAGEVFGAEELGAIGVKTVVCTADGSLGVKGFVTAAFPQAAEGCDYMYICGPTPMVKPLLGTCGLAGEVSMEERMGCGVGICYGCTCQTVNGPARVCKDGPVFKREELVW